MNLNIQIQLPQGWQCPCCGHIYGPTIATCPLCCATGQMNDDIRAYHDCPTFGPEVDAYFLNLETAPTPAPAFKVPQRPDIKWTPPVQILADESKPIPEGLYERLAVTVITPCLECGMPLDRCQAVRGGKCCDACDHFGAAAEELQRK